MVVLRLRPVDIKLLRDLWRMRGQALAIAMVAMCGIATLVTMRGGYEELVEAQILSGLAPRATAVRYPGNELSDGVRVAGAR